MGTYEDRSGAGSAPWVVLVDIGGGVARSLDVVRTETLVADHRLLKLVGGHLGRLWVREAYSIGVDLTFIPFPQTSI